MISKEFNEVKIYMLKQTFCFLVLQRVQAVRPRFRGLKSLDAGLVCLEDSGLGPTGYMISHPFNVNI